MKPRKPKPLWVAVSKRGSDPACANEQKRNVVFYLEHCGRFSSKDWQDYYTIIKYIPAKVRKK